MKRYYFLFFISLLASIWAGFVNTQTMDVLRDTYLHVFNGYGMKDFMAPIIGLLANGSIQIVNPILVKIIFIVSFIGMYISLYKIINKDNGNKLRDVFTFAYWRHIDYSFSYKPVKINKK